MRDLATTLSKSKVKILNKVESEDEKDAIVGEYKQLQDKIDIAIRSQNSIYKWFLKSDLLSIDFLLIWLCFKNIGLILKYKWRIFSYWLFKKWIFSIKVKFRGLSNYDDCSINDRNDNSWNELVEGCLFEWIFSTH